MPLEQQQKFNAEDKKRRDRPVDFSKASGIKKMKQDALSNIQMDETRLSTYRHIKIYQEESLWRRSL